MQFGVRVVIILLLAPAAAALAQAKPSLRILVDGVTREAEACGIRQAAIESTAQKALNQHGIQVSADAKDPYLYLHVNAYRVLQESKAVGCTTRLGVSVRVESDSQPYGAFRAKSGAYVVLCEAGRLLSGAQREVAAAITKSFQEDIKSCLAQLQY
jgi:hypothetical protein